MELPDNEDAGVFFDDIGVVLGGKVPQHYAQTNKPQLVESMIDGDGYSASS